MMTRRKLVLGFVLVAIVFFLVTFFKNWGTAVTENLLDKYKPEVKALKGNRELAIAKCPNIIKKLERGLPELAKSKDKTQVPQARKLIADCAFAAGNFKKSLEYYKQLSNFEPNVPRWHVLIAESLLGMQKAGDALQPATLATQLEPNDFEIRLLHARVLARLTLKNRAIEAYAHAIRIAPYDEIARVKKELAEFVAKTTESEEMDDEEEEP